MWTGTPYIGGFYISYLATAPMTVKYGENSLMEDDMEEIANNSWIIGSRVGTFNNYYIKVEVASNSSIGTVELVITHLSK